VSNLDIYDVVSIEFKVRQQSQGLITMDRLPTRVDRSGQDWQRRKEQNLALAADLKERLEAVKQGGGGKYVERHRSRGKMLPRERIAEICDPGSPFLELSSLAANELYDGKAQSAGIITGIGLVHGRECLFVANDATVKDVAGLKRVFRLHPPRGSKGWGGIKRSFVVGGALGPRGDAIKPLVERMI